MKATVAYGTGRYGDPWHPLASTSAMLADILCDVGFEVCLDADLDGALQALQDVDLLVVNASDPWRASDRRGAPEASVEGLDRAIAKGMGVFALHYSSFTLRDYPAWRDLLGGGWVEGRSYHPAQAPSPVRIVDSLHPITAELSDFVIDDEKYSELEVFPRVHPVLDHLNHDSAHPLVWTHEVGGTRVVYDALGHDERSYEVTEHREIVARAALWAVRRL